MKKLILVLLMFAAVQGMGQIKGGVRLVTGLNIDPVFIEAGDTTWVIPPCGIDVDTMRFIPERIGISPEEYYSSNLGTLVDYNSYDIPYLNLRKGYQAYCNQKVVDTLIQAGTVKCQLVGRTYEPIADTVWYDLDEKKYKLDLGKNMSPIEFLCDTISFEKISWDYPIWQINTIQEKDIKYFEVTRKVLVKIKQEKPSPEGFWIWVEENYLK